MGNALIDTKRAKRVSNFDAFVKTDGLPTGITVRRGVAPPIFVSAARRRRHEQVFPVGPERCHPTKNAGVAWFWPKGS